MNFLILREYKLTYTNESSWLFIFKFIYRYLIRFSWLRSHTIHIPPIFMFCTSKWNIGIGGPVKLYFYVVKKIIVWRVAKIRQTKCPNQTSILLVYVHTKMQWTSTSIQNLNTKHRKHESSEAERFIVLNKRHKPVLSRQHTEDISKNHNGPLPCKTVYHLYL